MLVLQAARRPPCREGKWQAGEEAQAGAVRCGIGEEALGAAARLW